MFFFIFIVSISESSFFFYQLAIFVVSFCSVFVLLSATIVCMPEFLWRLYHLCCSWLSYFNCAQSATGDTRISLDFTKT